MIIRLLIILITLQLSLIESCVRTIPPEEVYITSTPDNLPITEEPPITDSPVTDAPVTDAPITDAPTTDAPVTDAPVDPENLCMECDVKAVSPTPTDPAITFTSKILSGTGECLVSEMICERTDGKTCDSAEFVATTPTGAVSVTNSFTSKMTTTILSCNEDGTFSAGAANGITKLECNFINCVDACTTCDDKAIAPTLTDSGTIFTSTALNSPGECIVSVMGCKRNDGKTCDAVEILAITAGGTFSITDTSNSNSATTFLNCDKDGSYSWGAATTGITKLECNFYDCVAPCETCSEASLVPNPTAMPAAVVCEFTQTNLPGACLTANARCYKPDQIACPTFGVGSQTVGIVVGSPHTFDSTMPLRCDTDKKWKLAYGTLPIDRIRCFSDC
ncbi:hypothetical protein B9Z55_017223 [Caenorhabditis nigoni]|uniref:DUF281 domain-containing protein n=2 Tax=Caenorhabditis nigoni TaxID=1611254 RepID=A0A2G5T8E9_9PELO|nr:hypothetical protein B9Z55_017223 [Caenorhabditis nigoni]